VKKGSFYVPFGAQGQLTGSSEFYKPSLAPFSGLLTRARTLASNKPAWEFLGFIENIQL
jgi:hypothetical protein